MCWTACQGVSLMGQKPSQGQRGIWKKKKNQDDPDVKVVDTSYTSDDLAKMVIAIWKDPTGLGAKLTGSNLSSAKRSDNAKDELENNRGILLDHPIVITEDEYEAGWQQENENEVVFVLPNAKRAKVTSGTSE